MTINPLPILLLALLAFSSFGQNQLPFQHLSVEDGLSQGQVNCVLKDSKGFIWIGTQDGLNRYDGYTFKHYYHQPGDNTSLSNNYIWCLIEDSNEEIWVGTFGGELCRYNRATDSFQSFAFEPFIQSGTAGNSVRSLLEYPKGTLWIGADIGLWRLHIKTLELERMDNKGILLGHENPLAGLLNIVAICPFSDEELLTGSGQGLFKTNINTGHTTSIGFDGKDLPITSSLAKMPDGSMIVGTHNGLYQVAQVEGSSEISVIRDSVFLSSSPTQHINTLMADEQQVLWMGTNEGIVRQEGNQVFHYPHQTNVATSLSNDMVFCFAEIEPGLLWVGTRAGINTFSNKVSPFLNINISSSQGGLCSNSTIGLLEGQNDNLWIGTRQGLTRIGHFSEGQKNWDIECLTPASVPSMPYDYIIRIKEDSDGGLWVCFRRNGFAKLKKGKSGKWFFEKIKVVDEVLNSAGMNDMFFEEKNTVWLGTPGLGLVSWNMESNDYEVFVADSLPGSLKHSYIFCLSEDSKGRFWVGTANGGLCEMDKGAGTFNCHVHNDLDANSISSNMVLSIMEDSQKRLWACTANGLNLLESGGRFRRFYQKDGLPNNVVYGMLEDEDGNFWASTNMGISKITFSGNEFTTQNFTAADGLPGNEFNQHSLLKTKNGSLVFGGTGGITLFNPNDIQPYPYAPSIALTDFQIFNQSVPIQTGGILEMDINMASLIRLKHDQNFIAFEFAALGYTQPENNQYAYMMEGLDDDWVFSENRRFASYPNLQPGDYIFKIKASNHDGVWNQEPKTIAIKVFHPWWQTWWAYAAYALLLLLVTWGIIRLREQSVREIEQAKAAERERFRKRTARDFHDEAGNKITKISLLTEVSKRQASDNATLSKLLDQMEENIQELRSGMRDFIWVLDPENDNMYDTLLRLKDFANDLFEHSPTHFSTEGLDEQLANLPLNGNERRHLLLIFKEAMNNCAKYAKASTAVLSIAKKGNQLSISFKDNGIGFDHSIANGNGLRNMRERARKVGSGFFIDSKNGTEVRLEF